MARTGPLAVECLGRTLRLVDNEGNDVALLGEASATTRADGDEIVRRWNVHADLIAALEKIEAVWENKTTLPSGPARHSALRAVHAEARAAIAKAKGVRS